MILPTLNDSATQTAVDLLAGVPCKSGTQLKSLLSYSILYSTDKKAIQQAGIALYPKFAAGMYPELFIQELQLTPENSRVHIIDQLKTTNKYIHEIVKLWKELKPVNNPYDIVLEVAEACEDRDRQANLYFYLLDQRNLPYDYLIIVLNQAFRHYQRWSYAKQMNCLDKVIKNENISPELFTWSWDMALHLSMQQTTVHIDVLSKFLEELNIDISEQDEELISKILQKGFEIYPETSAKNTLNLIKALKEIIKSPFRLNVMLAKIGIGVLCGYSYLIQKNPKMNDYRFVPQLLNVFFAAFEGNTIGCTQGFSILTEIQNALKIDLTSFSLFSPLKAPHTPKLIKINHDYETKLVFHRFLDPAKKKSYAPKTYHLVESLLKISEGNHNRISIIKTISTAGRFFQEETAEIQHRLKSKALKFYFKLVPNVNITVDEMSDCANLFVRFFNLDIDYAADFIRKMLFKMSDDRKYIHQPAVIGIKVRAAILLWKILAEKAKSERSIVPILFRVARDQRCSLNAAFGFYVPISEIELSSQLFREVERLMTSPEMNLSHLNELALIILKAESPSFELVRNLLFKLASLREVHLQSFIPLLRALIPHCMKSHQLCESLQSIIYTLLMKRISVTIETEADYQRNFDPITLGFIEATPGYFSLREVIGVFFKRRSQTDIVLLCSQLEAMIFSDHVQQVIRKLEILSVEEILGYYHYLKNIYRRLVDNETMGYIAYFEKFVEELQSSSVKSEAVTDYESVTDAWNRLEECIEDRPSNLLDLSQIMMD